MTKEPSARELGDLKLIYVEMFQLIVFFDSH